MNRSLLLMVAVLVGVLPAVSFAVEPTGQRPNQYPSPTVKQPAAEAQFDADWPWNDNAFTGDWFGLRSEAARHGIVFGITYTSVMMTNTTGGFDTGFVGGGPTGITTTVDTERLIGLAGGTLFFDWEYYSWYNSRFAPNNQFDPTGSYVGVNTNFINSDDPKLNQIAQLYYEHSLFDEFVSLTFGKIDSNVPFADIDPAGAFQNNIAMFTSTLNPFFPSYPNEANALIVGLQPTDALRWKIGWFDGTTAAFDPATGASGPSTGGHGLSTFFDNDGHWFLITQWDYSWQLAESRAGSISAGAWLQTGLTATSGTNTLGVRDVPGWYMQWQQTMWAPSEAIAADGGGITYFGQFGWSDPNKNPAHWSMMAGVSGTGIIPSRPADAAGFMFALTEFTNDTGVYQSVRRNGLPGPTGGSETSLEMFYIWQWMSWSYLQPGLMWIADPGGGDPAPLNDVFLPYLLVGAEF